MESFDLIIIGSGPGGYVAAIRAAQLGLQTAIVEKDKELGGTCLNIGCIPSKALLSSSDHFAFAKKEAAKHGILLDKVGLDLAMMLQRKDKVVKTLTGGVRGLMKLNKVTTFQGIGNDHRPGQSVAFKPREGAAQEIEAKNIIIATGSVPMELPSMKFDGNVIVSSTEALLLRPKSEETARHRRRRDRAGARFGLEPARFGSHRARISSADRARFRSRTGECAAKGRSPRRA